LNDPANKEIAASTLASTEAVLGIDLTGAEDIFDA